jgi:putative addiction module CopG family antidote
MEVHFTSEQLSFIRQAIENGRLKNEEEAIHQAMSLWEERERTRTELLAAIDEAESSISRGNARVITEQSMRDLASDVKQRGRVRLAAGQSA